MANAHPSPAEELQMLVNHPHEQQLMVLGHEIDDRGGTEGSYEYVMSRMRGIQNDTRIKLDERGVLRWALPDDVGNDPNARYIKPIAEYSKGPNGSIERMRKAVLEAVTTDKKILSLGGNHLRATELLGVLKACHELGIELGIVWTDAHPDQNTPELSETKNVHGMVSAIAMGEGPEELLRLLEDAPYLNPKNIIYVGINAPELQENDRILAALDGKGIKCITRPMLAEDGLTQVYKAIAEIDATMGEKKMWWNELDVDVLADSESEGKVMPNPNGMYRQELHHLCVWMGNQLNMLGCGVSEIAPAKDPQGKMAEIVTDSVAALLKVPNVSFAKHMEHETAGAHVPSQAAPSPVQPPQQTAAPAQPTPPPTPILQQIAVTTTPSPSPSPRLHTVYPGFVPTQSPSPRQHPRRRVLDFIAGVAATVAAMIVGNQLTKTSPENQVALRPGVLEKGSSLEYTFTGISPSNRFSPPNQLGKDNYSMKTFLDRLQEYKNPQKFSTYSEQDRLRMLYSILYLSEMKGDAMPMLTEIQNAFGSSADTIIRGYREFSSSISQLEQKEIDRYMQLWSV